MATSNLQDHLADDDAHVQYLRQDVLQAIGDLIVQGISGFPENLPVQPSPGFVLVVSFDSPFRPSWEHISLIAIPKDVFLNKGDLLAGTGTGVGYAIRSVGNPGDMLTPDPTEQTGLIWRPIADPTGGLCATYGPYFQYPCASDYMNLVM